MAGRVDHRTIDGRKLDPSATATYAGRPADGDGIETAAGLGHAEAPSIAGGRFEVRRLHARGGLGEVSLAFDRELNRPVALKKLLTGLAHDPDAQARFLREAEITGSLEHLVFKGGTSLSKVFGAIDRFSENIDLSLSPAFLGLPEPGISGVRALLP